MKKMRVLHEGITAAQTATSATQPQAEHGIQRMGWQIQVSFRYLKTNQLVDLGDYIQAIVVGRTVCKILSLQLQHGARFFLVGMWRLSGPPHLQLLTPWVGWHTFNNNQLNKLNFMGAIFSLQNSEIEILHPTLRFGQCNQLTSKLNGSRENRVVNNSKKTWGFWCFFLPWRPVVTWRKLGFWSHSGCSLSPQVWCDSLATCHLRGWWERMPQRSSLLSLHPEPAKLQARKGKKNVWQVGGKHDFHRFGLWSFL